MNGRRSLTGMVAFFLMLVIILDGKTALNGAQSGIELCLKSVIPSLFPFFILSRMLIQAFSGTNLPFFRPLAKLCGIAPESVSILLCGLIGGYPVGAQCVSQAYHAGSLDKQNAERMLAFCSNAGPSFIFGLAGSLFPGAKYPWMLWLIHMISAILCACLLPGEKVHPIAVTIPSSPSSLSQIVNDAVRTMGNVCGWILFFRVISAFLHRWFLWALPETLQVVFTGMLELSNGCFSLEKISDIPHRFMTCSGILAFGGLCVFMQTKSVIDPLSIRPYITGKLMQTILSIVLSAGFLYNLWIPLALGVPLFWIIVKKRVAIPRQVLYNGTTNQRRHLYAVSKKN